MNRRTSIRRLSRHRATLLVVLAVAFYMLVALAVKWWFYPGWTWKGFLGDIKSIATLGTFLSPFIIYTWKAYQQKSPEETVITALRHGVSSRFALLASSILLILIATLSAAILIVGEGDPSPDLLRFVSDSNWTYADEVIKELQKDPLRPEVQRTLETFVRVHESTEQGKFKDSLVFYEYRNVATGLLRQGCDMDILNSLSFAEASKAISFIDNAPPVLQEGYQRVEAILPRIRSRDQRSAALTKLGELSLAAGDYAGAQQRFQDALRAETHPSQRARILASIGNALASQGKVAEAVELYHQAESDYPDGRRYIFYSNFGYLLLMANDYDGAEIAIRRALSIRQNDWVSYLNLALVYDATQKYEDAESEYEIVADKADSDLVRREGLILSGRSAELGGRPFDTYITSYIRAEGHAPSSAAIERLRNQPAELKALYHAMAIALKDTSTHGIESYILWFEQRSKTAGPRQSP